MQEFFMDYGLWLLIALLVVIGLVFLLSGKGKSAVAEAPAPVAPPVAAEPIAEPVVAPLVATPDPVPVAEPVIAEPVVVEETPAPAPVVEPAPAPIPASPAVAAPADEADDLLKLKGVGPKLGALLTELGVTRYAQIAGWSDSDIAAIDAKLGNFKGRPVRQISRRR
ncbi:hypothetical protein LTR94_018806 [Friedmanniomyces endolithicus]|nr:hypothetical protein LTR94_018806 [Friedmanniomyces endolithicus]